MLPNKTQAFINPTREEQPSAFLRFISNICPCLLRRKTRHNLKAHTYKVQDDATQNASQLNDFYLKKGNKIDTKTSINPLVEKDDVSSFFSRRAVAESQVHKYVSASKYDEDKLLTLGCNHKVLTRVHSKLLSPSGISVEKTKSSLERQHKAVITPRMQEWWKRRYFLFQKFDLGIKFDDESYISTPPEALTCYLASRIKHPQVLNVFGGIGAYAIKLANTCQKVTVTDIKEESYGCLDNNLGIYMVDNVEILPERFMEVERRIDAVLVTPPWGQQYSVSGVYDTTEMRLGKLFSKALRISSNVVMVLPSNIDLGAVLQILGKSLETASSDNNRNCYSSCSFEVEKVYFLDRIRFIVIYYGTHANREVKLSDELEAIYDILESNTFKCRRLVKHIREQRGLPFLLNLCLRLKTTSPIISNSQTTLENLIRIISTENIITDAVLKALTSKDEGEERGVLPGAMKIEVGGDTPYTRIEGSQGFTNSYTSSTHLGELEFIDRIERGTINIRCESYKHESVKNSVKLNHVSEVRSVTFKE